MEYLVNSSEMKRCDSNTVHKIGVPSMVLMERAALSSVEELYDGSFNLEKVIVVCGSGNNGGDGFAVARLLYLNKINVDVLFIGDERSCTKETKQQMDIVRKYGIRISKDLSFKNYTTIVDAIFGIGISRSIEGKYAEIIDKINRSQADVLSLDIPSGISADTGKIMGIAIKAKRTVTFGYKKVGLVLYPGAEYAGVVKVKDIGITDIGFENQYPFIYSYTKDDLKRIPKRQDYSNKGTYGKVLVIAGAVNMGGAAYFAAKSTYKMGVGLVKVFTPEENRTILQTMLPEAILSAYDKNNIDMESLKKAVNWASAIVLGPGMGIGKNTKDILSLVLSNTKVPLVIDADGINTIAKYPELLENHHKEIILTPHLGEMARLIKKDISQIANNLIDESERYAGKQNIVCVLKDTRTIVSDGKSGIYVNQSGNNGMATGGAGDVLTGVIAGLLGQGMKILDAATLGVYIHGLAGDIASEKLGHYSVLADDIIDGINEVLKAF